MGSTVEFTIGRSYAEEDVVRPLRVKAEKSPPSVLHGSRGGRAVPCTLPAGSWPIGRHALLPHIGRKRRVTSPARGREAGSH